MIAYARRRRRYHRATCVGYLIEKSSQNAPLCDFAAPFLAIFPFEPRHEQAANRKSSKEGERPPYAQNVQYYL